MRLEPPGPQRQTDKAPCLCRPKSAFDDIKTDCGALARPTLEAALPHLCCIGAGDDAKAAFDDQPPRKSIGPGDRPAACLWTISR